MKQNKHYYTIEIKKHMKLGNDKKYTHGVWMHYGDRAEIDRKFQRWCKKNGVLYCINSFIVWVSFKKGVIR